MFEKRAFSLKMMRKLPGVFCALLGLIVYGISLSAPEIAAAQNPWQIKADTLTHLKFPESILAEGNVVMSRTEVKTPAAETEAETEAEIDAEADAETGKSAGAKAKKEKEKKRPKTMALRADWVRYDVERGVIKARGNVYIITGQDEILAEATTMDLEAQTGIFTEATVFMADDHLYVIGREIDKTGETTYIIHDGWASACDPYNPQKKPPWGIRSRRTDVRLDGMAIMEHARFHVKNVPVLYTPWMTFPVKTKRETGFLFPEWSHSSRNGSGVNFPFFVNIAPNADLTLYPGYLQRRGMMYGVEARYAGAQKSYPTEAGYARTQTSSLPESGYAGVPWSYAPEARDVGAQRPFGTEAARHIAAPRSYATAVFDYLGDKQIDTAGDEYKSDGYVRTDKNRYWFRGKMNHDFSESLIGRADVDFVSDRDFIQEFRNETNGFVNNDRMFLQYFNRGLGEETSTNRTSSAQLVKSWRDMVLSSELSMVQDVSDVVSMTTPVQTLPRINFTGRTPLDKSLWSVSWNSEYANYWRKGGLGGQKLDAHPSFITALPRGSWVEGSVNTGLRESLYYVEVFGQNTGWDYNRTQARTVPNFGISTATLLMRDFDLQHEKYQWLEHIVRPNIGYGYAPRVDETRLPPFGDNTNARNAITYGVNNYFELGGTTEEGDYLSRNLGLFNVSQSYSILEDRRSVTQPLDKQRVLSEVNFDLSSYPLKRLFLRYQTGWSVYGQGITNYNLLTQWADLRGDSLSLDYRYTLNGSHDVTAMTILKMTSDLGVEGGTTMNVDTSRTVRSFLGLLYEPPCWKMEIRATREIEEQTLMVVFYLDVIGKALGWDNDKL